MELIVPRRYIPENVSEQHRDPPVFRGDITADEAADVLLQCKCLPPYSSTYGRLVLNGNRVVSERLFSLVDPSRRDAVLEHFVKIGLLNLQAENARDRYPTYCILNTFTQEIVLHSGVISHVSTTCIYNLLYRAQRGNVPCSDILRLLGKNKDISCRNHEGASLHELLAEDCKKDMEALSNALGLAESQMPRPVDVPIRGKPGYYWALGNVKRAIVALFGAARRRNIYACGDIRRLLGAILIGPIRSGGEQAKQPWVSGKWRYERETWHEGTRAIIARITARLPTLSYRMLSAVETITQRTDPPAEHNL